MIIKIYDLLVNAILIFLAGGYAVDQPSAEEAVALFFIHNAITLFLTALSSETALSKFKIKFQRDLGKNFVIYHLAKFFLISVMLVVF
jgi:hypothetical protein